MRPWEQGQWLNPPVSATPDGAELHVRSARGSDFWQRTSYGFRRDSGHALLRPLTTGGAVEVCFVADFSGVFEQAGVLVRVDDRSWVKAGVEFSDGVLQLSAVVTRDASDWSTAPVPTWHGREVTVRASWSGAALTVRARVDREPWQLVRLAPFADSPTAQAGPYCCSPDTDGLVVRFTDWREDSADAALH